MSKTVRNNFDKSSTGTDIECRCYRDTHQSQLDFSDNIEIIQHSGRSTTSIGYYTDNGNVKGVDDVKFTVKGDKAVKIKWYVDNVRPYEDMTENDIDAEILETLGVNIIDYALDRLPTVDGLEFVPNKNLIVLTTRGYCQGDYARVIYCPEDLETAWGVYPKQENVQESINHYYWDAPIYCCFEINGEEYNYHDMPEYDEYEWERKKFIAYVAKESGVPAEKLESFVPEYPEYN